MGSAKLRPPISSGCGSCIGRAEWHVVLVRDVSTDWSEGSGESLQNCMWVTTCGRERKRGVYKR